MKKFLYYFLLAGVCLLWANLAQSEILRFCISGDISGQWGDDSPSPDTTYVYVINGKSWVPSGSQLTVGPGVTIRLECSVPVDIYGGFEAKGTGSTGNDPIEIRAIANAEGFCFWGTREDTVLLEHVYFSQDSFPRIAITSIGRTLKATACEIRARWAAIQCFDAPVEITNCKIFKTGGGGAALTLGSAADSRVEHSSVKVEFMGPDFSQTAGIHLTAASDVKLTDDVIEVSGPGYTAGIHAENRCHQMKIDGVRISAQSENLVPRGIWLADAGYCNISSCTVSVDSRSPAQAAIWLYGRTISEILNCSLTLGGAGQGELVHQESGASAFMDGRPMQPGPQRPSEPDRSALSGEVWAGAAFPNPFNMTTTLPFELGRSAMVEIAIINILGREVDRISYGMLSTGHHLLSVSANSWPSGDYVARIVVDGKPTQTQRLVLIK
jgi:hypothetical protein